MQEKLESFHTNLLPGAKINNPDEIGVNRTRHLGEVMLGHFRDDIQSPVEFAKKTTGIKPFAVQARMLNAAATKDRVLILNAPKTGASTAGAIFSLHRIMARRNHRVLIISPDQCILGMCSNMLRSNSLEMIDAKQLFRIRTETGYWASEHAKWGIQWATFSDIPANHISDMIRDEDTIIIDNAHRYRPEFLMLLQDAVQSHQQLLVIGRDANRALQNFENDPCFFTVRASIDQTPFVTSTYLNMKREQFRDHPDDYEQIFQIPIDWEPVLCPA